MVNTSSTTFGALVVTFAAPSGTPPFSYTGVACTNSGMTNGCVTVTNYTSGAQLSGLNPGTRYYVQITAVAPTGYVNNNSTVSAGTIVTYQLPAPTSVSADYGTVAGSLSVNFTSPTNAAPGQTYTVKACTNVSMTTGCVSNANFTSGNDLAGLSFVTGNSGALYWAQVTANASPGYTASPPSTTTTSHADTSRIGVPGAPTASTSANAGALVVTFAASPGVPPSSYSATACTDQAMTTRCVTVNNYSSNSQLSGLRSGRTYYVQITAVGPTGYVDNLSAVSNSSTRAG
jgi:hypothetical protein